MQTFKAHYFNGISSKGQDITLELHDSFVYLNSLNLYYEFKDILVRTKLKNTPQTVSFKDGSYCELSAEDFFALPNKKNGSFILKLESKLRYALFAAVILAGITIFALTVGSTFAANVLSEKIPQSAVIKMSEATLEFLDEHYLETSKLDDKNKTLIEEGFERIFGGQGYKLHFRSSPKIGANAFALPSGDIVLLDELVYLDKDEQLRGVIAVLAHESGHVVYKHGLKLVIKSSITSALIGYLIGDFSGFITTIASFTIDANYSREYESEADAYAITTMRENNISTLYIADIFDAMIKDDNKTSGDSLLSSHPSMRERIEEFRKNGE